MRTRPGSIGAKSSVLPPSVFVNLKVMRRASSPMRDNQTRGANYQPRTLGPVQVSGRGDDRDVGDIDTDQASEPLAHRVDAPATELRTGTDQRDLHAVHAPAC